jgi:hypothetical protein
MPERVTVTSRSKGSAEAIVIVGWAGEAETADEGPNE